MEEVGEGLRVVSPQQGTRSNHRGCDQCRNLGLLRVSRLTGVKRGNTCRKRGAEGRRRGLWGGGVESEQQIGRTVWKKASKEKKEP